MSETYGLRTDDPGDEIPPAAFRGPDEAAAARRVLEIRSAPSGWPASRWRVWGRWALVAVLALAGLLLAAQWHLSGLVAR